VKRPSAWPLLVILLVIGAGFSLLVFHDRIQTAERLVAEKDEVFREQGNLIQRVERDLEDTRLLGADLQAALQQAIEREDALESQIQNLNGELELLSNAEPDPGLTTLVNNIDTQLATLWTVTILVSFAFLLESFFFR